MKILVLANFGMGLYKFRKELLQTLVDSGHEVYVSFPNGDYVAKLEKLGCKYIESKVDRRGTNPITDIRLLFSYLKIIRRVKPEVVLTYSIKPNVYGGLACQLTKTPYIASITGLGTAIENKGFLQKIALRLYRLGLRKARCVFFENEDNRNFLVDRNIVLTKSRIVRGSGVNLEQYRFEEYPPDEEKIKFLFIGRIMKAKGIEELLEAAVKVKEAYSNVEFDLIGFCEEGYQHYLKQMEELGRRGIVNYHGHQENVHSYIINAHATILPSYHEGTSNALLESEACGRPVLASKIPGCIETFDEGITGFGFEVKSASSLTETIVKFIQLPYEMKHEMGQEARRKMERDYDRKFVIDAYLEEINHS